MSYYFEELRTELQDLMEYLTQQQEELDIT
jgi:hypothetical protein